jgi:hypothetical protein
VLAVYAIGQRTSRKREQRDRQHLREPDESYTQMLWMRLRKKAAYLPGC